MINVYSSTTHSKIDYREATQEEYSESEQILKTKFKAKNETLARHPLVRRGLMSMEQSFYNEELNLLPTGLVAYLKLYYKQSNLQFKIHELRKFPWYDKDFISQEEIILGQNKLRPYQKEAVDIVTKTRGGIIQLPVGAGKCLAPDTLLYLQVDNDFYEFLTLKGFI